MSDLKKKKKSRAGHKGYMKQALDEVDHCLENYSEERKAEIVEWKETLREQLEKFVDLSVAILALMEEDDTLTEEDLTAELYESNKMKIEVRKRLAAINERLTSVHQPVLPPSPSPEVTPPAMNPPQHQSPSVRARLPKLEVRKFGGVISEWQEFWDSFESAIHKNEALADVDKFSYLRGLLVGPARSAIAGFALTSANYKAATDLLKRRYGRKNAIQRAHINELLNLEPIYSERDPHRLRQMYDFAETKLRALEALGVEQDTYAAIVVPSLLEKLPEQLRLTITRGEDHHEWDLEQLLQTLGHEVELREEYNKNTRHARSPRDDKRTIMYAGKETNCAFCLGGHKHEECKKVTQISERKRILLKYGRCFNCIRKGHVSKDCKTVVNCKFCKGKHHSCLWCADSPGEGRSSTTAIEPHNVESVGSSMHIETGGSVALQTAQVQVAGKGNARIRVLFDSASHMSFVTSRVAKEFSLETRRKE